MSVQCHKCGQQWDVDPRILVDCPKCQAKPGHYCIVRRPSGHTANFGQKQLVHVEREQLALDKGFIQRCPAAPPLEERTEAQASLF